MEISVKDGVIAVRDKAIQAMSRQKTLEEMSATVIAVSKTKPKEDVLEAYFAGQRHFGENYVAELEEKATDPEIKSLCDDIKWHFIGHLQSNKVNRLLACPNLYMIHTIDSIKLANIVNQAWGKKQQPERLKVMVQVNISEESTKSGISPEESYELVKHIREKCCHLEFHGLMTIGRADHDKDSGPNPDFGNMLELKYTMCNRFNIEHSQFMLSMGMSHDYEHAIEMGSNYVRVGTAIFGPRKTKA